MLLHRFASVVCVCSCISIVSEVRFELSEVEGLVEVEGIVSTLKALQGSKTSELLGTEDNWVLHK